MRALSGDLSPGKISAPTEPATQMKVGISSQLKAEHMLCRADWLSSLLTLLLLVSFFLEPALSCNLPFYLPPSPPPEDGFGFCLH